MSELETADYAHRETPNSPNPIFHYFKTLQAVLTRPSLFFRDLPRPTGIVGPLFFGILTSWFGSALQYFWYMGFGRLFESRFSDLMRAFEKVPQIDTSGQFTPGQFDTANEIRKKITEWVFGVGAVLIDPFKTFIWILFLSTFIWIAARLFANRDYPPEEKRLRFETAISIVAFSQAAALFKGVPMVGGVLAVVFAMVIAVIGATETYRVSTGRAIVIALFPTILFWGIIIASILAFFSALVFLFVR